MQRLDFVPFRVRKWSDGEAVGKSVTVQFGAVWLCDLTGVKEKKAACVSMCESRCMC